MSTGKVIVLLCLIVSFASCYDEQDKLLWEDWVQITLVDNITKEHLIGHSKKYHPDSINVFNESWEMIPYPIRGDSSEDCYEIFIDIDKSFNDIHTEILALDTIFYIKLPGNDIDTVQIRYEYDQENKDYYMIFNYNNDPYRYSTTQYICGAVVEKK